VTPEVKRNGLKKTDHGLRVTAFLASLDFPAFLAYLLKIIDSKGFFY
jgi:hypothetical protein